MKRKTLEELRKELQEIIKEEKEKKKIVEKEKRELLKIVQKKNDIQSEIQTYLQGRLF